MAELVGILNITPDSFSDGGQYDATDTAIKHAAELYAHGAKMVDAGAESTRPGAPALDWRTETDRLSGFVQHAGKQGWNVSLDTYHPETVGWASQYLSKFVINDVTNFRDPEMRYTAAELAMPIIVSHLPASSYDIQSAHKDKPIDSVDQVVEELEAIVGLLIADGVARENITVDPGIGFGKTPETNWKLLKFGCVMPDYKVMIGYSRKRFLGEDRMELEPNLRAGRIAVEAGATYLRVHDVKGHAVLLDQAV